MDAQVTAFGFLVGTMFSVWVIARFLLFHLRHVEAKVDLLLKDSGLSYDPSPNLPPEVMKALHAGEGTKALRLYKQATGMGSLEAGIAIEYVRQRHGVTGPISSELLGAIQRGDHREALRLYQRETGRGWPFAGLGLEALKRVVSAAPPATLLASAPPQPPSTPVP